MLWTWFRGEGGVWCDRALARHDSGEQCQDRMQNLSPSSPQGHRGGNTLEGGLKDRCPAGGWVQYLVHHLGSV